VDIKNPIESATIEPLELFLFTNDRSLALEGEKAGVDSVIVDWEQHHKHDRQRNYSTEINSHTPEDARDLAAALTIPVTVRINALNSQSDREIGQAIDCGASLIMLPMARQPQEVASFLKMVGGRAKTIVQIETIELWRNCQHLRDLDWDRAYVGLNDLMISRQKNSIWELLADGTVERVFTLLGDRLVGFGGVTRIGGGSPLPFLELLQEMARLGCRLSVLRRSFKREVRGRNIGAEIQAIRAVWIAANLRDREAIESDHLALLDRLRTLLQSAETNGYSGYSPRI
jgi:hypothetical protein